MNEELICSNRFLNSEYKYYVIESLCDIDCLGSVLRYGVKIDKYNDNNLIDSKCVKDIFSSKEKMQKAVRILGKLQVTPITLEDIIIDNI